MDYVGQMRHSVRGSRLVTMQTPSQTAEVTSFASTPPTPEGYSSIVRQVWDILLQIVNHQSSIHPACIAWAYLIYEFQFNSHLYQEPSSPGPLKCVTTRPQSNAIMRRRTGGLGGGSRKERIKILALSANKLQATSSYWRRTITSLGSNHRPLMILSDLKERNWLTRRAGRNL